MAFNKGTSVCGRVRRMQDAIYETSEKSGNRLASLNERIDQNRCRPPREVCVELESVRETDSGVRYKKSNANSTNQDICIQTRAQGKFRSAEPGGTFTRNASQESCSTSRRHQEQATQKIQNDHLERKESRKTSRRDKSNINNNNNNNNNINIESTGHQSSGTDRSNKVRQKGATTVSSREANESAMQNHHSHINHNLIGNHYGQRQHVSSCAASKLVNHNNSTEMSPRFKHHQPHCVHHNPHYQVRQQSYRPTNIEEFNSSVAQDLNINSNNSTNINDNNVSKFKPVKCVKQQGSSSKSYLLVKYRPSQPASNYNNRGHRRNNGRHQEERGEPASSSAPVMFNNNNSKRTTIKFISQLYFLLHLSAILSLLLHHKNLVASDWKPSQRWSSTTMSIDDNPNIFNPLKKQLASNESSDRHNQQQQQQDQNKEYQQHIPTDISSNQLPVPLMQKLNNGHLINSVVGAPADTYSIGSNSQRVESSQSRFARQTNQQQQQFNSELPIIALTNSDILVRLVGYFHARSALHYFLCYLLSSSVTILICLRLFQMCNWQKKHVRTNNLTSGSAQKQPNSSQSTDSSNSGFYYRTRLDCTPVLIGSISLGLIQLIVIGVEIANNVDWLSDNRWPIYLPFLQFAFVSLLMQFILGKVAKNHGHKERQAAVAISSKSNTFTNRKSNFVERQGACLSINNGKRSANNNGREVFNFDSTTATKCSPISNGLQNIALAHLLVTHILLWLMKLNSISLFQALEHQQHLFHHRNSQEHKQQHHRQQHSHLSPVLVDHSSPASVFVASSPPSLENFHPSQTQNPALTSLLSLSTTSISTLPLNPMLKSPILFETANLSNSDTSSKTAHGSPINISSSFASDRDHQRSRAELESILRRKPILVANRQADSSSITTPQQTLADVDNNNNNKSSQVVLNRSQTLQSNDNGIGNYVTNDNSTKSSRTEVKFILPKVTVNESNEANLKSERGLRSADRDFSPQTSLIDQHKLDSRHIKPSTNLFSGQNSTSVTISQEQLLNLLSLASRANERVAADGQQHANKSATLFKSSLPKRMTAFRQTSRPKISTETSNSVINSIAQPKVRPKQRARVLVTTSDDLTEQNDDSRIERKQNNDDRVIKLEDKKGTQTVNSITSGRPFPSVESDPTPTLNSNAIHDIAMVLPASSVVNSTFKQRNTTPESEPKRSSPGRDGSIKDNSATEVIVDDNEDETNHESSQEGDNEDSDIDLDAQLPPVPNYNETTNDETKREAAASMSIFRVTNDTEQKIIPNQLNQLQEEPFVFNEAASNLNATLSPPLLDKQKSRQKEIQLAPTNSSETILKLPPTKEALMMPLSSDKYHNPHPHPHQQSNESQPSFADYLLPIVYQYHILVVAILFNMWLDSLCKTRPINIIDNADGRSSKFYMTNKDSLTSSSSSNVGSDSHASSTKGLIAIPIRKKGGSNHLNRFDASQYTEPKYPAGVSGFALERVHKSGDRWRAGSAHDRKHHRSRSMDFLHQTYQQQSMSDELESFGSSLSRFNSLRSSSSERLLWIPKGQFRSRPRSAVEARKASANLLSYSDRCSATSSEESRSNDSLGHVNVKRQDIWNPQAFGRPAQDISHRLVKHNNETTPGNSVCSIFFGLLIVSGSLIVILLGIDLLSTLAQCATQLISILVCLLGLMFTWRSQSKHSKNITKIGPLEEGANLRYTNDRLWHSRYKTGATAMATKANQSTMMHRSRKIVPSEQAGSHRQFFHYLFLLAAYYCGISIALNLTRQISIQQLFSQQVVHFIERNIARSSQQSQPSMANYLFFFHLVLAIKGLLLIVQVTLQTVLIRSSCQRATRDLRQIYTFLMFANLSLWAMEICEQQQHLQRYNMEFDMITTATATTTTTTTTTRTITMPTPTNDRFRLITLDNFTRFAASIVTLSHLYHGLVFMQH